MGGDAKQMMEECAQAAQPAPEHESLARFEGKWRAEVKLYCDPSGEPNVSTGMMTTRRILGGRFLQQEYEDDAGMFSGRGFWGYNTIDKRYEGFWIDSMSTFFQIEHGRHDPASDTYHMRGAMTCPSTGKPMTKRSEIRVTGPTEHSIRMFFAYQGESEFKAMEIRYRRA